MNASPASIRGTDSSGTPARRPVGASTKSAGYRLGIAARVVAAIGGGYAVSACITIAIALALRDEAREEAVNLATLPSFLIWTAMVVWAFAARSALRAWLGVAVLALLCAVAIGFLRSA